MKNYFLLKPFTERISLFFESQTLDFYLNDWKKHLVYLSGKNKNSEYKNSTLVKQTYSAQRYSYFFNVFYRGYLAFIVLLVILFSSLILYSIINGIFENGIDIIKDKIILTYSIISILFVVSCPFLFFKLLKSLPFSGITSELQDRYNQLISNTNINNAKITDILKKIVNEFYDINLKVINIIGRSHDFRELFIKGLESRNDKYKKYIIDKEMLKRLLLLCYEVYWTQVQQMERILHYAIRGNIFTQEFVELTIAKKLDIWRELLGSNESFTTSSIVKNALYSKGDNKNETKKKTKLLLLEFDKIGFIEGANAIQKDLSNK
jgi:hypothetical protein